jgi:hypothetical protein
MDTSFFILEWYEFPITFETDVVVAVFLENWYKIEWLWLKLQAEGKL